MVVQEGISALISQVRQERGATVVQIEGRFDVATAPTIKAKLQNLISEGNTRLVLNLSELSFIDSSGLGVLVSCLRKAAADGGDLRLAEVPPFCRSIFELTRLTRVFEIGQSEREALSALSE